jgi:hypothetical protein
MKIKYMYKKGYFERKGPKSSNEKISFYTPSKNHDYAATSGPESDVADP